MRKEGIFICSKIVWGASEDNDYCSIFTSGMQTVVFYGVGNFILKINIPDYSKDYEDRCIYKLFPKGLCR